jgi:hypothetical protein
LDIGLNSAEIDAPKAKKWRGCRTNLPFAARLGLGAAALAAFFGGLTLLPDAAAPLAPPETFKQLPTEAIAASDTFIDALKDHDTAGALELLDSHAPQRRKVIGSLTAAFGKNPSAELGPPLGAFYPVGGANRLPGAAIRYELLGNPCPSGQPERLGEFDTSLFKSKGHWTVYWASYRDDRTPCS